MTRGKQASKAANRRAAALEEQAADLRQQLTEARAELRQAKLDHRAELDAARAETSSRVADYMAQTYTDRVEAASDGLSAATWVGQRVAMTEHLAWLFFQGFLHWDRLDGDREVLQFIATHGDLKAWWVLASRYGWRHNYKQRREDLRMSDKQAVLRMLSTLRDIRKAGDGDDRAKEDREALDAVVDRAREAFLDVELEELLSAEGFQPKRTEEDRALSDYVLASLQEFARYAERVS